MPTVQRYLIQLTCTGNLHGDPASLPFACSCVCLLWIDAKSLFSLLPTFHASPTAHLCFLGLSQDLFPCSFFSPPWPARMQNHLEAPHSGVPMHGHVLAAEIPSHSVEGLQITTKAGSRMKCLSSRGDE